MNKELIKKYKAEFDHWLKNSKCTTGNSLLVRYWNYSKHCYGNYTPVSSNYSWDPANALMPNYVINDEYVEIRKALADGNNPVQLRQSRN